MIANLKKCTSYEKKGPFQFHHPIINPLKCQNNALHHFHERDCIKGLY